MTTKRVEMLQEVWRKGWAAPAGKPLRIPCGTQAQATQARFALYNAVREVRKGSPADETLREAVHGLSIMSDGCDLVLTRHEDNGFMQALASVVGDTAGGDAISRAAEESQRRLMERLEKVETAVADSHRATPYYTRQD